MTTRLSVASTNEAGHRDGESIHPPESVADPLLAIPPEAAEGSAITLVSADGELTVAQAADILNVSQSFVEGLLERGEVPHRSVGATRRIPSRELFEFQRRANAERSRALDELVAEAQAEGMGY